MLTAYLYPTPVQLAEQKRQCNLDAFRNESALCRLPSDSVFDQLIEDLINEFVWVTHKGGRHRVSDMATPHLFYSLRMVFNHSVPPVFRIGKLKRYDDVSDWSPTYRAEAIAALAKELETRDDLDTDLAAEFEDMKANTRVILALGL